MVRTERNRSGVFTVLSHLDQMRSLRTNAMKWCRPKWTMWLRIGTSGSVDPVRADGRQLLAKSKEGGATHEERGNEG